MRTGEGIGHRGKSDGHLSFHSLTHSFIKLIACMFCAKPAQMPPRYKALLNLLKTLCWALFLNDADWWPVGQLGQASRYLLNLFSGCSLCPGIQQWQEKNVLSFFPGSTWAWWTLLSPERLLYIKPVNLLSQRAGRRFRPQIPQIVGGRGWALSDPPTERPVLACPPIWACSLGFPCLTEGLRKFPGCQATGHSHFLPLGSSPGLTKEVLTPQLVCGAHHSDITRAISGSLSLHNLWVPL
jgi:hypothetical protein